MTLFSYCPRQLGSGCFCDEQQHTISIQKIKKSSYSIICVFTFSSHTEYGKRESIVLFNFFFSCSRKFHFRLQLKKSHLEKQLFITPPWFRPFFMPVERDHNLVFRGVWVIVHYDTSAMNRFLTSVSLQHEPKASDSITLVKKTLFRKSIVRNFISRGVKMRISAREACVKPHLRTRSDIKTSLYSPGNRTTAPSKEYGLYSR